MMQVCVWYQLYSPNSSPEAMVPSVEFQNTKVPKAPTTEVTNPRDHNFYCGREELEKGEKSEHLWKGHVTGPGTTFGLKWVLCISLIGQ